MIRRLSRNQVTVLRDSLIIIHRSVGVLVCLALLSVISDGVVLLLITYFEGSWHSNRLGNDTIYK